MTVPPPRLCVVIDTNDPQRAGHAGDLAKHLGVALLQPSEVGAGHDMALVKTGQRLELRILQGDPLLVGGHPVASDLTAIDTTSGPGRSLGQPLIKAVGIKRRDPFRPSVVDVTAGLGEDAWVLASVGCETIACERNPVTHALLADGLERAGQIAPETAGRLSTSQAHGVEVLHRLADTPPESRPDVVYLDPMFPLGRKTAERKAMRVLRLLSGDDTDAHELLQAALPVAGRRVVVKRPLRAPAIQGPPPTVIHKGKSLRFDVYVTR